MCIQTFADTSMKLLYPFSVNQKICTISKISQHPVFIVSKCSSLLCLISCCEIKHLKSKNSKKYSKLFEIWRLIKQNESKRRNFVINHGKLFYCIEIQHELFGSE